MNSRHCCRRRAHDAITRCAASKRLKSATVRSNSTTEQKKPLILNLCVFVFFISLFVHATQLYWRMRERQWERVSRGTYWTPGSFSVTWFATFMLIYIVYLLLQLFYFERQDGHVLEFVLMLTVSAFYGYALTRFHWLTRLIGLELYSFALFFFLLNLYNQPQKYLPLALGVIGAVTFTLLVWFVYPYLHRCFLGSTGAVLSRLVSSNAKLSVSRYEIDITNWFNGQTTTSVYEGEVHRGRPHGFGSWADGSASGESLMGWFEHGEPVGPFESVVVETRTSLSNVRIMFATCAAPGQRNLLRARLAFGVAAVECCVSGNFFRRYPRVNMISPPTECRCGATRCTCVSSFLARNDWRHIDDVKPTESVTVMVDKRQRHLLVSGHVSQSARPQSVHIELRRDVDNDNGAAHAGANALLAAGNNAETLIAHGAARVEAPAQNISLHLDSNWLASSATEGLLYIHGVNHTLKDSIKRFGQFLALSHLPNHIKPFCFHWPSSQSIAYYFCAQNIASDTDTHRDLLHFLLSMRAAGIRRLHIMCHSMGTRIFLRSWPALKQLFEPVHDVVRSDSLADLAVASNANSINTTDNEDDDDDDDDDVDVDDKNGSSRRRLKKPTTRLELMNVILLNPDYELEAFRADCPELRRYCSRVSIYADRRDTAMKWGNRFNGVQSLGANFRPVFARDGQVLDFDLIDTSDLDRNMPSNFHGYFNVSKLMVDDLRDLIVFYRRAEERTSRLKRLGDIYRFSTVPSIVNMV